MPKASRGSKTSTGPKLQKIATSSQADALLDKGEKWYYEKLTDEEKKAVVDYTIYNYTNNEKDTEEIKHLQSALEKFELDEDIVAYRGVSSKEFANLTFSFEGKTDFKSTSTNEAQAMKFAEHQGGYLIEYHIKKGKHGAYLEGVPMSKEKEYLINKGQNFKVVGQKGKRLIVEID